MSITKKQWRLLHIEHTKPGHTSKALLRKATHAARVMAESQRVAEARRRARLTLWERIVEFFGGSV